MNPKDFEEEFLDTFKDLDKLLRVSGIKSKSFKIENDDDEEPLNPFEDAEEPETYDFNGIIKDETAEEPEIYDFNGIIKEMTEIAESMDEVPSDFVLKWVKDLVNAR